MKWTANTRPQSVLGLSLTDGSLRAHHVARVKGTPEVVKGTTAALTLSLLHPEPELVGREIRNHLDAAGLRERRCVVSLPAGWVMSHHTRVPDLSPEDVGSFLEIEAEKAFPCDPSELQIARSLHRSGATTYVTQLAVRREQIEQLSTVLRSAGLKPVSFSIGLAALEAAPETGGRITVAVEPKGATLLVSAGGGLAAFRTSESSIDSEAGENVVNGAAVARELRITLEQLPPDLRLDVREVRLVGDDSMVRQLAEAIGGWSRSAGLTVVQSGTPAGELADQVAQRAAVRWLENTSPSLEFLPPKPSRWATLMSRYSSKRLAAASFAVGAVLIVLLAAFGWLEYCRWSLRSEWGTIRTQVAQFERVQSQIREFRPWYDTSFRNLTIVKRATEAFPDTGTVTAKTIEIRAPVIGRATDARAPYTVSITGSARENAALLHTLDQLRNSRDIESVKVEQISGKTPAHFTFSFRWNPNSGS